MLAPQPLQLERLVEQGPFLRALVELAEHAANLLDLGKRRIGQALVAGGVVGSRAAGAGGGSDGCSSGARRKKKAFSLSQKVGFAMARF